MYCHECGNKLKDGAVFCGNCGVKVTSGEYIETHVHKEAAQTVPESAFTYHSAERQTGTSVSSISRQVYYETTVDKPSAKPVKKKKKSKLNVILITLVVLAVLGGSGYLVVNYLLPTETIDNILGGDKPGDMMQAMEDQNYDIELELNTDKPAFSGGSYLDTYSDFSGLGDTSSMSDTAKIFAENIIYEVVDINTESDMGTATVIVSTPDLTSILSEVIEVALNQNPDMEYSDLLMAAQGELIDLLSKGDFDTLETKIELNVIKEDSSWKLIPNEEWYKAVSGNITEIFRENFLELLEGDINEAAEE